MAKNVTGPSFESQDTVQGIFDGILRLLMWVGVFATAAGLGLLLYTFFVFAGDSGPATRAAQNIEIFQKIMVGGVLTLALCTTIIFWGEETLAALQLLGAAALYFSPFYLPSMAGEGELSSVAAKALNAIQTAGAFAGAAAILVVFADVMSRIQLRVKQGAKAEQLKYGKGIKEEKDIHNVFMGRCWQLPFCRKFVRERCPIYHSRRTCWKERVGCMCEEQVIRNAMEGRAIPRDAVAAAKYIPRNAKLSLAQKAERCRTCVIYNEHQKHKYKLALPSVLLSVGALYFFAREPLLGMLGGMLQRFDKMIGTATYRQGGQAGLNSASGLPTFKEILLICIMFVLIAYMMKIIEYLFFKLKV